MIWIFKMVKMCCLKKFKFAFADNRTHLWYDPDV